MTYDPSIPIVTNNISADAVKMQVNFSQADILFGLDHYKFDDFTPALRGLHKKVVFPQPTPVIPVPAGTAAAIYTQVVTGLTELFYANAGTITQLSGLPATVAQGGSIKFANGIIMQWGRAAFNIPSNTRAFTFAGNSAAEPFGCGMPAAFPNNCFFLTAQVLGSSTPSNPPAIQNSSITATGFNLTGPGQGSGYMFFAIGN